VSAAEQRTAEVRASLADVRIRIDEACRAAGRPSGDVTLVAVTKFFPASDAVILAEAGVRELGESRDQEASAKVVEVAALTQVPVRWHFLGRLQRNKARSVAGYADMVHSLDRTALIGPLAAGRDLAARGPLDVLLQVSLDESETAGSERGGLQPAQLAQFADEVLARPELRLAGVMAVAPIEADPDAAFAALAEVSASLTARHPGATVISAGMSGDLEAAIRHGATHVRIGTALLGRRAPLFR
jgi:pyridoxal phosphate enzyme (YggS family)